MLKKLVWIGLCLTGVVQAQEFSNSVNPIDRVYATVGVPGLGLGLGHSVNHQWGLRAEFLGGSIEDEYREAGINYQGELDLGGLNGYVDYFLFQGRFRLTAGFSLSAAELNLEARGTGAVQDIGGVNVVLTPADFIRGQVEFPDFLPYLGLGWGHSADAEGFYFGADLGVFFGSPEASLTVSPNIQTQLNLQDVLNGDVAGSTIERERRELEDAVDLSAIPSLNVFVGYRF